MQRDANSIKAATEIDSDAPLEEDLKLGARIRSLRQERKLSLQLLASRAELSVGMISQIERGLSSPSLRSLRLLGSALGVPISLFFDMPPEAANGESKYVVRRRGRRVLRLTPTGVRKELLSPDRDGRLMELYELVLQAGGSSGQDFYQHEGEKAGVVTSGQIRLWIEEQEFLLSAGDSFQFASTLPHKFDNPGQQSARLLWINSPPIPRRKP